MIADVDVETKNHDQLLCQGTGDKFVLSKPCGLRMSKHVNMLTLDGFVGSD